jgi:hypothetical protein
LTEIPIADAANGDLILYFEGQLPTHAGLIKEPQVISNWGKGHVYQHSLLEVPSSYGNEIRSYRKLLASVATMRFVEYVRSHPDYAAIQEMFEEKIGTYSLNNHAEWTIPGGTHEAITILNFSVGHPPLRGWLRIR